MDDTVRRPLMDHKTSRHWCQCQSTRCATRRKRAICSTGVFLGIVSLATISVVVVTAKLKASFSRTVSLTYMNQNVTWAEHFNGKFVERVTMEPSSEEYWSFTNLYAFSRLPSLSIHRKYHWKPINYSKILYRHTFMAKKMYLNAGSLMNVSFCGSTGVQVLVIQHDAYIADLDDPDVQNDVKLKLTFPGNRDNCRTLDFVSYYCTESAAYQFVFAPWNLTWNNEWRLILTDMEYEGDTMQYNVETGATDHCNITMARDSGKCSVHLDRDEETGVVLDVGNIPFSPGEINIAVLLTCTFRNGMIGTIVGSALGGTVFLALTIILAWNICITTNRRTPVAY